VDALKKPSEHVRLFVEQIIVPYLGMILLNCFSKMFEIVQFLADRTNGRAIGTVLRLSVVCLSVCDVMYCG